VEEMLPPTATPGSALGIDSAHALCARRACVAFRPVSVSDYKTHYGLLKRLLRVK